MTDLAASPDRVQPAVPVTVHLPAELADELTDRARAVRLSRSGLVRRLCEDFVAAASTTTRSTT